MTYSIGEISRMFDIPVSTLRYYDAEGLFPNLQRKSGIRIFTDQEVDTLRLIECLKSVSSLTGQKKVLLPIKSGSSLWINSVKT